MGRPTINLFNTGSLIATKYNKQCMNTKSVIPRRALQAGYRVQYLGRSSHALKPDVRWIEKTGIPYYDDIYFHPEIVYSDRPIHTLNRYLNEEWKKIAAMPDEQFVKPNTRTRMFQLKVWKKAVEIYSAEVDLTDVQGLFYEVSTLNSFQDLMPFHVIVLAHLQAGIPVVAFDSDRVVKKYGWRLGGVMGKELPAFAEQYKTPLTYVAPELFTGHKSLCDIAQRGAGYQTGQLFFPIDPDFPVPKDAIKEPKFDLVYVGNDYDRTEEFFRFYFAEVGEKIQVVGDFADKVRTKRVSTKRLMEAKGGRTDFPGPVPYTEVFDCYHNGRACVQIATKESCESGYITPRANDVVMSKRLLLFSDHIKYITKLFREEDVVSDKKDAIAQARSWWKLPPAKRNKRLKDQRDRLYEVAHIDIFWGDLCGFLQMGETA